MTFRDPPRLSRSADPQFRSVLRAAKSDLPDPERLDRIFDNIRTEIGPGPGGGGGGGGSSGGALGKLAGATIAAGAVMGAIFLGLGQGGSPSITSTSTSTSTTTTSTTTSTSTSTPPAARTPVGQPSAAVAISALPDAPPRELSEISLLQSAQQSLPSNPRRSLDFITRHERAYPKGDFAEERDVIRIDALVRLGRKDEALSRAADHQRKYPASAHRPRVEALLAK